MRTRLLTLLAVLVAVLVATTAPASAHGDEGEVTLTKLSQTGPTTVAIEVGIVYEGDGHLAEDAQVTATLTGPGGASVGPVELVRTGETTSLYAASVEVPAAGEWSVTATSQEPEGEVTGTLTVTDAAATSTTEATTTTESEATTSEAPDVAAEPLTTTAGETDETDEDGGTSTAVIVGACLVLALLVIGGAFVVANRRSAKDRVADSDVDAETRP